VLSRSFFWRRKEKAVSKLSNQLAGQCQKGLKVYAKGGAVKGKQAKQVKKVVDKDGDAMKCGGKVKK